MDDFQLVINSDLSSISHRFRDTAPQSRKPPHPGLSFHIEWTHSQFVVKLTVLKFESFSYTLKRKLRDFSFSGFVTIHSRHKRQQTDDIL